MRVLFLAPLPEPTTGQSLASKVFLDALVGRHEVDVLDIKKRGFANGFDSLGRAREALGYVFSTLARSRRADLIYFTIAESVAGNLKDLAIMAACWPHLDRIVLHLHGGAGLRRILRGEHPLRRLNEFFLRRIAGVVVLGPRHVDLYEGTLPSERIFTVPNFAQDYLFADRSSIQARFREVGRPVRVLFLSNLIEGKGHLELLDAFLSLPPSEQERLEIDFAGGFESEKEKTSFLSRIQPYPMLRYHGIVGGEVKRKLFHRADVFCLPTYYPYEGQPISILEAYASGCVVVTTDHSGIRDVFEPGVNGYLVEKRSSPDLARVLRSIAHRPAEMERIGLANNELAKREYRTGIYAERLMAVFSRIAIEK